MQIRKTTLADLPRVMEIYAAARAFMAAQGNPRQSGPTCWPPEALVREDIRRGRSHVCVAEDGAIAAVFFFDRGMDIEPGYRDIREGAWEDEGPYGVVHRIAVDKTRPEKGVGAFCLDWAFARCGHLRIDTHGDNRVMQGLLARLGFTFRGIIHVAEDNDPRLAYEKSDGFRCRIPTEAEMVLRWDDEIARQEDKGNWLIWRERAFQRFRAGSALPYYGFLDGVPIDNAQNTQVDLGRISTEGLEKAELFQGQRSRLLQTAREYGSASALHLTSAMPAPEGRNGFKVRLRGGSFGTVSPSASWESRWSPVLSSRVQAGFTHAHGRYPFHVQDVRNTPEGSSSRHQDGQAELRPDGIPGRRPSVLCSGRRQV